MWHDFGNTDTSKTVTGSFLLFAFSLLSVTGFLMKTFHSFQVYVIYQSQSGRNLSQFIKHGDLL